MNAEPRAVFAYVRRLPGMEGEAVEQVLKELAAFTAREGLALADVHYERRPGQRVRVWSGLIESCRNEGVTDVVVPSAQHFNAMPELAAFLQQDLAEKIGGRVWLADAPEGDTSPTLTRAAGRAR